MSTDMSDLESEESPRSFKITTAAEDIANLEDERVKLADMYKLIKELGPSLAELTKMAYALQSSDSNFEQDIIEECETLKAGQMCLDVLVDARASQVTMDKYQRALSEKRRVRAEKERARWALKRAAPSSDPVSSDADTLNAQQASSAPPAKKAKKRLEPPRRPIATDSFYSYLTKYEEHWANRSQGDKFRLSHIGRIEETDAGKNATIPCAHCKGYTRCRIYKEEGIGKYFYTQGTNNWRSCGKCRSSGYFCSFVYDAMRDIPTAREIEEDLKMEVCRKYMDKGLHQPSKEVFAADVEELRREKAEAARGSTQAV